MSKKIYVASSWRNPHQPEVVNKLREAGYQVYDFRNPLNGTNGFDWSEIDPNWEDWTTMQFVEALKHPIAEKGFHSDFDGMNWADICVMVLPCGRSANTEAGWMKGAGKQVFVLSPVEQEPELMYKMHDGIYDSLNDIILQLQDEPSDKEVLKCEGSSVIGKVEYYPATNILEIFFNSGKVYKYLSFPFYEWTALKAADSVGKFYNMRIKDKYQVDV